MNQILKVKAFSAVLTTLLCLVFLPLSASGSSFTSGTYVPGELVIKLKPSVINKAPEVKALMRSNDAARIGIDSLDGLAAQFKAVRSDPVFRMGETTRERLATMLQSSTPASLDFNPALYQRIIFPSDVDVKTVVEAYKKDPNVQFAEPNYVRRPVLAPNPGTDPDYHKQWHLNAVNAPQAWQFLEDHGINPGGSRDVVIAVIDTGVDYTHPDLSGNMWINSGEVPDDGIDNDGNGFVDDVYGANVVGDSWSASGDPADDHGHGTHVAGIAAAQANNKVGGVGVAFNAQIMAIKAAQYSGVLTTADIAEGIIYAVDKGADVINMSFGGYFQSQVEEDALAVAFGYAVLVAAAGNDAKNNEMICNIPAKAMYPASYPWVLGVMASAQAPNGDGDWLAGFSNRDVIAENSIEYNLMAPGAGIYSTLPGNQFAAWSGTSMSTPVVSGIAALVRSYFPNKDTHSSRFIMGQIAPTGPSLQGYSPSCAPPISYHMADALAALASTPQPRLTYLEHWLFDKESLGPANDDDGRVDAGETVDLAITIRNHWGKADNVQVTLRAWNGVSPGDDPYVTLDIPTVDYGAVGSFNIDDNGLIYDEEGEIIGVNHPFRFTVSPDCPNDHVIPFQVTMTCSNGYDPADPNNPYTFASRFELVVQRGLELPRFISEDMTLTSDNYYIVPDATLVNEGVTLTIQEGTQIQFWSSDPEDPYSTQPNAKIVVAGTLLARGTAENPVKMFPGSLYPDRFVVIQADSSGVIDLQYAKVTNPYITGATVVDHCYFDQDSDELWYFENNSGTLEANYSPTLGASVIRFSILHKLGIKVSSRSDDGYYKIRFPFPYSLLQTIWSCLFDSGVYQFETTDSINNVFLKNYKLFREQWGDRLYGRSRIMNWGPIFDTRSCLRGVFPESQESRTYWLANVQDIYRREGWPINTRDKYLFAEGYARQCGGHIVAINNMEENAFLSTYLQEDRREDFFEQQYPDLKWEKYRFDPVIGFIDLEDAGIFKWISCEPVSYTNWDVGQPGQVGSSDALTYLNPFSGMWHQDVCGLSDYPILLEIPHIWSQAQIDATHEANLLAAIESYSGFRNNAILNCWHDPNPSHWLNIEISQLQETASYWYTAISGNYWGTQSKTLIDACITDFNDNFYRPQVLYEPILTTPPEDCYPFVTDVVLSIEGNPDAGVVGAEPVTFTVTFNRDMDTFVAPQVSFGPDMPETDYTVHPVDGGWTNARTWQGTFNVTPVTGDGYQFIRVAGAVAADDPWLVTGDDSERFRFEIITSGTESMNLQATGGEGYVDLMWTQDDFDLLAGFNLYRSTTQDGTYSRINGSVMPPEERNYRDTDVQPGQPYYYVFTVVKSDMTESDSSNVATATPTDTIPPVISHTPVTSAAPGIGVTIHADVTDNVGVTGVTLYYRAIGASSYQSKIMPKTTGNRYSATLEGSLMTSPGVEYYIQATDGVSTVRSGEPSYPWQILVQDKPVVNSLSPDRGPTSGGTAVTISGSNFKNGAGVTFGGAAAGSVTWISANQLTCTTPAHFPETVDVVVTNPDAQTGTLLRAFTYESEAASLSLPNTGGGQNAMVQVPVNIANVEGLVAADLTIAFDSGVLNAQSVTTGNLIPGWTIQANVGTPGQILISMASPGGSVTGSGILTNIQFQVAGAPGASTALTFGSASLNDGAIPAETSNGQFTVDLVYGISGMVQYWNGGSAAPGVLLTAEGDRLYTGQSGADGAYTVPGLPADDYTLTPSKSDETNGISAYDASLVLQHAVQLITLTGHGFVAGDVNKSGAINSMDASYILQKAVDLIALPFPGAGAVWEFSPASRSYTALSGDQANQDFTGILIGDVSGDWSPDAMALGAAGKKEALASKTDKRKAPAARDSSRGESILSFGRERKLSEDTYELPLMLRTVKADVYAGDIVVTYPKNLLEAVSVKGGQLAQDAMVASNVKVPGEIRMGLATPVPITGSGELMSLIFRLKGDAPDRRKGLLSYPIRIQQAIFNDKQLKVSINQK